MKRILLCLSICCFSSLLGFKSTERQEAEMSMDEIRLELADLKHALHTHQVDLRIAEEKLKNQESTIAHLKSQLISKQQTKPEVSSVAVVTLEKKVMQLEKMQEKTIADLHQLNAYAHQTTEKIQSFTQEILQQNNRLDEVVKLKSTLSSLSKAMSQNAPSSQRAPSVDSVKTYKVKGGDSLEKIARHRGLTVETLKKLNHLDTDRISIDQILKLPADEE